MLSLCVPDLFPGEVVLINRIDLKPICSRFEKPLGLFANFAAVMFL